MIVAATHVIPYELPTRWGSPRRGWLLEVRDRAGRIGWGEAVCWPERERYPPTSPFRGWGIAATEGALARLEDELVGGAFDDPDALAAWSAGRACPQATCAAEVALLDLLGQERGCGLANLLGERPLKSVASHVLIRSAPEAARLRAEGVTCFKLKVGRDPNQDLRCARAVRQAIGPATLRLDANGAWESAAQALSALKALAEVNAQWVEQPLPPGRGAELAELRRVSPIHVAVDEGLASDQHLEQLLELEALDAVVLKPMFVGGLLAARRLARRALLSGLPVILTHALESVVGRTAALHLAAALRLSHPCGLASTLASDLGAGPELEAGRLTLPAGTGLGVHASPHPLLEETP